MKNITLLLAIILILTTSLLPAQETNEPKNLASTILENKEDKLNIGGYGQIDLSKPLISGNRTITSLDVSRMVLSMGYNFTDKTQFLTELEFEHVREVFVEQAFVSHYFGDLLNFRAGFLLVLMGIINEYHEPTTFNGVNRPSVDNLIVPTTWREIGAVFTGRFTNANLKYQGYIFNGFRSYDGTTGLVSGSKFLRDGRQRGARSIMSSPNFSGKIDYYGIPGVKLGLAGYAGKTESPLFNNLDKSDNVALAIADSSIVKIIMAGLDLRYQKGGLSLRGEAIISSVGNTPQYNTFTGKDVGKTVNGFYAEVAYNILQFTASDQKLTPFFRMEHYDTHFKVDAITTKEDKYNINEYLIGIGWKLADGAVLKTDIQMSKSKADNTMKKALNAGIGVWF